MKTYDIAVTPGDGIGPEVTAVARAVLDRAAAVHGFGLRWTEYPLGAERYLRTGETLPPSVLSELAGADAMLLGAIGDPRVKPGLLERDILLALRFHFDQYANVRPAVSFPGVPVPVAPPENRRLDAVVVRENTEDLYMGLGGRIGPDGAAGVPLTLRRGLYALDGRIECRLSPGAEASFAVGMMSRPGIERVARRAFALARTRGEAVVHVVTKANAMPYLYGFWDDVVREAAGAEAPELECRFVNVDAMVYLAARDPARWGVVLCPNLFGDIVSDLFSALAGGLGLAASGNFGDGLSMFEPVHGSAPDIAGTGRANPLAAVLSGAMMLEHLGEANAAAAVRAAVAAVLADPSTRPVELGGLAATETVGHAVAQATSAAR